MRTTGAHQDEAMGVVFQALAHDSRRRMLDIVMATPGISIGDLAARFDVSRVAVMKHVAVLEEANLLIREKHGRSRRLYFNPVPIQLIYERWTTDYSAYWSSRITDIKRRAEARARQGNAGEEP